MELSIILVNYNSLDLLRQCLSCLAMTISRALVEIIIVDNASTDGSREWLESLAEEQYRVILSEQNLGFAGGCNLGIRQATGDYILLLNTDAFPQPGALEELVAYLEQHPDVGIVGPQLLYPDGRWQRSTGLIPSPKPAMLDALGITSARHVIAGFLWRWTNHWWRPRPVEYLDGACMLIRRQVIDQIGGFDDRLFFFVEDAEFCHRARRQGWNVVHVPQSRVVHLRGGSSSLKNYEQSVKLRVQSERIFVLRTYGQEAWRRFLFWRRWNYRGRMCLAALLGRHGRRVKYRLAWQIYAEAGSWM